MIKKIRQKLADERGATAIEYGLIAASISIAIIVFVTAIGGTLEGTFETIADSL